MADSHDLSKLARNGNNMEIGNRKVFVFCEFSVAILLLFASLVYFHLQCYYIIKYWYDCPNIIAHYWQLELGFSSKQKLNK